MSVPSIPELQVLGEHGTANPSVSGLLGAAGSPLCF